MANREVFTINYVDDFGTEYGNLRWRADRGMIDRTGLTFDPVDSSVRACGGARYFTPRKLVAQYADGKSIEVIVGALDAVAVVAGVIAGSGGNDLVCLSLKGERWSAIPPGVLGGNYVAEGITVADKPEKTSFAYLYFLDGGANQTLVLNTNIENDPGVIFSAQQSCLQIQGSGISCGVRNGIKPRHFLGQRANLTTGGKIARKIIVSVADSAEIKACGASVMGNFNCLGYQGTSIPSVKDFYDLS